MKETTVEEVRAMNCSDFCLWGDENFDKIEYILSYEDFSVVKYQDYYFFYEHIHEMSSDAFYEVEIIAQLDYDINHDLQVKNIDILHSLFDCDMCGEYVHDKGISYLWFKEKE